MKTEQIKNIVCNEFGITSDKLLSSSRKSEIVDARHVYALVLRELGFTLKFIAKKLNRKDHSTIINLLKQRSLSMPENKRRAKNVIKAYRSMTSIKNARHRLNMKEFLELVQKIN
jgi:chromosomal replication initiation ATPase DnaA